MGNAIGLVLLVASLFELGLIGIIVKTGKSDGAVFLVWIVSILILATAGVALLAAIWVILAPLDNVAGKLKRIWKKLLLYATVLTFCILNWLILSKNVASWWEH